MELGTLWFGADIDLTALRQKIQSGNQSILDALKINYDPASYTQMVNDLKHRLSNEVFEIKVSANAQQVRDQLSQTISNISNSASTPKVDLSGLKGIPGMTRDIIDQKDRIRELTFEVEKLKNAWKQAQSTYGQNTRQAKMAYNEYKAALRVLQEEKTAQFALTQTRARATLAQQELNREMREASRAARQWNSDHLRLNTTLAGGIHISTQLGSALSSLFAIDAARQFLGQVIEIGGQLEKQRISIGAILGDTVKASHLFEQIKGLALKSPFGVVELDQYTKQLSAYGFKYNELFDMTKRLADISAGAGTDIGRLTLALGHVRSATYLTGITLRQFSMNNIPMLKMLADYYTELEGKIVSTAEVQKRISKRQVSYQDVIEQIKRLTDEGGMFYNMQEKISDSLAAKFKNLKDAMDIMYGEIAESSFGSFMKDAATELTAMTRHWKEIGTVLAVASTAFVLSKIRIGLNTAVMHGNTIATLKQIMADKQLTANNLRVAATYRTLTAQERIAIMSSNTLTAADVRQALVTKNLTKEDVLRLVTLKKLRIAQAMHLVGVNEITAAEIRAAAAANKWRTMLAGVQMSLKNAFMGIGAGTWLTLGAMVTAGIFSTYSNWADRIDEKAKEMTDVIKSRIVDLQKQQNILNNNGQPKDLAETKARVDEMKQVLANSEAYTKTIDDQLKGTTDINKQYSILSEAIDAAVEKNRRMLDYQEQIAEMIKHSSGDFYSTSYSENLRWFFNDDVTKNMSQTLDAYKDLRTVIDTAWEYKDAIKNVIDEMQKSGEISGEFADRLKNVPFEEQLQLLAESKYWDVITRKIAASDKGFLTFADRIKEAAEGVSERWEEIANDDIPRMMEILVKNFDGDEKKMRDWALNNIDDFKMMLDGINDQLGLKEPAIRKRLKRLFYDYVRFGDLEKGLADAAGVGASLFGNANLKKILGEEELADLDDESPTKSDPKGAKKDKILEAWKNRYDALKTYYDEVQKYVKLGYDVKSAMKKVKDLGLGDGSVFKGMEASKENYANLLRQLLSETDASTTQRAKLQRDIKSALGDFERDGTKEQMDRNVAVMKDYIKVMDAQWKLYREVMKKTGNREFASLAFNDGVMWDEASRKLLEEFNAKGAEKGILPINFEWRLNEKDLEDALRDADGIVQKDMVELAKAIQKTIRGNYTNFIKDTTEAYSKSLSAQEKLNELLRQKKELEDRARRENSSDAAVQKGYQIQIKAYDRQIADQQWEAFKEVNDWGRVFGNLDRISTSTLQVLLENLKRVAPQIKDSVEATKALYEAIAKIEKVTANRNPIEKIVSSISSANALRKYRKQAMKSGDLIANSELSRLLNVSLGSKVTRQQIEDALEGVKDDFEQGLSGLAADFKAIQNAIQPVIDLFEQLGDTTLSDIFKVGNDMFGAASQTVGALNSLGLEKAGPYGAIAAAGVSVVTSVLSLQEQALRQEIENSKQRQKLIEKLSDNIGKMLDRAISGIYDFENSKSGKEARERFRQQTAKYPALYGVAQEAQKKYDEYRKKQTENTIASILSGGIFGGGGIKALANKTLAKNLGYITKDLVDAIQKANDSGTYLDMQRANLLMEKAELQHQLALEEESKNSDTEKVQDYKQEIQDLEDEIRDLAKTMAQELYGIDFKSWANDLAKTLVDAWASGENAVEAYKKKVSDILKELGVKMITERFISNALEPIMERFIKQYEADNGVLTDKGYNIIAEMYETAADMADHTSAFMDGLNEVSKRYGADLKDTDSKSSSVGSSIKGVTENTADLLAGYINAIRADVSVQRVMVAQYYPMFYSLMSGMSTLSQSQVMLQTQIAANTKRNADAADKIYDLLHKVAPDGTKVNVR